MQGGPGIRCRSHDDRSTADWKSLREVALLFLRLGATAFGGPAAHMAMMRDEVVRRRKWLTDQEFLDFIGVANLIPGPSSTELAILVGHFRAGWRGLIVAGTTFIVPAMVIVLALAWGYSQFGSTPGATAVLYGVKPVIIAIVVQALWGLGRAAVKNVATGLIGAGVLIAYLMNVNPIVLLFGGGLLGLAFSQTHFRALGAASLAPVFPPLSIPGALSALGAGADLGALFLTFLKLGLVVYGSGYVLLAFLREDFVLRLGWLSDQQLLDAIAIGQITPGPVFTTATFIGYLVAGLPGALVSTLGIFLPSFILVAVSHRFVKRLRASPTMSSFLDGANAASVGLMAAVTCQLALASIVGTVAVVILVVALVVFIRTSISSLWVLLAGGLLGIGTQLASLVLR